MFFGKNNNITVNVNTQFFTSFSDVAMVTLSGWNKQLSLKVSPCVGKDASGVNQYAQDNNQQIITSITQDNANALYAGYSDVVKPKMEAGESAKVSISMGSDENRKVVSVGYDAEAKNSYLEIVWGVSSEGIASDDNVIKHVFKKKSYLKEYNSASGEGEEVLVEVELNRFMKIVEETYQLNPVIAHSINYQTATKAAYGNNKNSNLNSNNPTPSQSGYTAPTSTYSGSEMGDFIPFS